MNPRETPFEVHDREMPYYVRLCYGLLSHGPSVYPLLVPDSSHTETTQNFIPIPTVRFPCIRS